MSIDFQAVVACLTRPAIIVSLKNFQGQMRRRSQVIEAFGDPRLKVQNKTQHASTKNCRAAQLSAPLWFSCWPRSGECSQLCSVQCYSLTNGAYYDSSVSLRIVGRSDCLLVFNFEIQSVHCTLSLACNSVSWYWSSWQTGHNYSHCLRENEMRYLIQLEKHPD